MTTPQELDKFFRTAVSALPVPAAADAAVRLAQLAAVGISGPVAVELFDAQLASRQLDLAARWLRSHGEGFYTIGSSGHEGNAAVAAALRPDDPALLHYRSGAFYCVRAGQVPGSDPIRDVLRGLVASTAEPIAGGRHKVFGHPELAVIPTTSTIASHLPRAVGLAFAIEAATVGPRSAPPISAALAAGESAVPAPRAWPSDAVVVCSFGDASINHSVAQGAFNTAGWFDHSGQRLPLLFVCEDNGLGISVASPPGWVEQALRSRPGLRYLAADGCDLAQTYAAAVEAVEFVRTQRRPAVLHLRTVRLMGHAGADAEIAYRGPADLAADLARDPLVATATLLIGAGLMNPAEILARYDDVGWGVRKVADEVVVEPRLGGLEEVVAPLARRRPVRVSRAVTQAGERALGAGREARLAAFGGRLPEQSGPLTLAQTINATLTEIAAATPGLIIFGEDVGAKGGVYGVTKGLRERFGARRVFDTLLDETSILGLAIGAGLGGLLPVPEIQYLAYLHNAEDQLRGEAATMQFFSKGAYRNPIVVRVAGLAYQQGFGGHFHNDNSVAVLRDIPGLVLAVPASAAEAGPLLRTCLTAAQVDGSVCVFLEPIALYHTKDLHSDGDGEWLAPYAPPQDWARQHAPIGRAAVHGAGEDLTIITFGNGVRMSLRVAARFARQRVGVRVVDLRWLAPLPHTDILREASATGRVLVVDETRRSGGVGEGVLAALIDAGYVGALRRVWAADSPLPLGDAVSHLLVSEDMIEEGARCLLGL